MYFIVSTGRSGTTAISNTLSLINDCTCLHEPEPALIKESAAYHYGELSDDKIKAVLLKTRKAHINNEIYCESNQTLSLLIPLLNDTYPQAKFIWLIRNGLDVVASTYQKQWYTGHSENHDNYNDCPPLEKAWIDGRIQADQCGVMTTEEWNNLDRFGKCCWYWSYINNIIEKDFKKLPHDKQFIIRLEEFDKRLRKLYKWMGLKALITPAPKRTNTALRDPFHWSHWNTNERSTFEKFCGAQMDRYYPEWRDDENNWNGVDYIKPRFCYIRSKHRLITKINNAFTFLAQ